MNTRFIIGQPGGQKLYINILVINVKRVAKTPIAKGPQCKVWLHTPTEDHL